MQVFLPYQIGRFWARYMLHVAIWPYRETSLHRRWLKQHTWRVNVQNSQTMINKTSFIQHTFKSAPKQKSLVSCHSRHYFFFFFFLTIYIHTIFILGLNFSWWVSSWAGYKLLRLCKYFILLGLWRREGRESIPGAAVQQPSELTPELGHTTPSSASPHPHWAMPHSMTSYAAP